MEQAVRQLPPQQQVVFRLSKFQRLRHKEIADLLNVTVSTVTNNLGMAMKKIRLLMQQKQ
jgi:RNA polymerase sigma-70 factor (ECF subfamily)